MFDDLDDLLEDVPQKGHKKTPSGGISSNLNTSSSKNVVA